VLAAAVRRGLLQADAGADLLVDSAVPVGAGLSSSAALGVAVALALTGVHERAVEPLELAWTCSEAERVAAGAPTGLLDQLASLLAQPDTAVLLDFRSLRWRQVPLAIDDARFLVIDTRVEHDVGAGPYAERRASVEEAARRLAVESLRDVSVEELRTLPAQLRRRARHVVTENRRVLDAVALLEHGGPGSLPRLGELLTASHASLGGDFSVSCPELDVAVDAALAGGAFGARLTGAGFGGSVVALVPADAVDDVKRDVRAAFGKQGWVEPAVRLVRPGGGASRLR
jgi:galactokinase